MANHLWLKNMLLKMIKLICHLQEENHYHSRDLSILRDLLSEPSTDLLLFKRSDKSPRKFLTHMLESCNNTIAVSHFDSWKEKNGHQFLISSVKWCTKWEKIVHHFYQDNRNNSPRFLELYT